MASFTTASPSPSWQILSVKVPLKMAHQCSSQKVYEKEEVEELSEDEQEKGRGEEYFGKELFWVFS